MTNTPTVAEIIAWHETEAASYEKGAAWSKAYYGFDLEVTKDSFEIPAAMHRATVEALKLIEDVAIPALEEQRENLAWILKNSDGRLAGISDWRDEPIKEMCEKFGYGAVMDSASRQWQKKALGDTGAFLCGPCIGTARAWLKNAQNALTRLRAAVNGGNDAE